MDAISISYFAYALPLGAQLDTIHQRDRRTDRRTPRATAKTALTHSIGR